MKQNIFIQNCFNINIALTKVQLALSTSNRRTKVDRPVIQVTIKYFDELTSCKYDLASIDYFTL